mmetsp:Transcript_14099/g.48869  ORF Transcript_14099/g.48869 Transcript_14099/m.48869 type:complete len:221 (+) Transcript_14099:2313-2975(+)
MRVSDAAAMAMNNAGASTPARAYAQAMFVRSPSLNVVVRFTDLARIKRRTVSPASALYMTGAGTPDSAKAQRSIASVLGEYDSSLVGASLEMASNKASCNSNSGAAAPLGVRTRAAANAVEYAQTVLARSSELNKAIFRSDSRATASKSNGASKPILEKLHAAIASSCGLNSATFAAASAAKRSNNAGAEARAVANAHAVFAKACGLNVAIFWGTSEAIF